MLDRDVFLEVIEALPTELKNDSLFKKIFNMVLEKMDNVSGYINASNILDINNPLVNRVKSNNLFSTTLYNKFNMMTLSLRNNNDGTYYLKFVYAPLDGYQNTIIVNKKLNGSVVEIIKEKRINSRYLDYKYDIKLYDKNYHEIKRDMSSDIDKHFSVVFGVPIEMARFLRLNFKKFAPNISKYKVQKDLEYCQDMLQKDFLNSFMRPFNFGELREFINTELDNERYETDEFIVELAEDMGYFEEVEKTNIDFKPFLKVYNELVKYIGNKNVVMSSNLYQDIVIFLLDLTEGVLYTKGVIISKDNGFFTYYFVEISNEEVKVMCLPLSEDEAHSLYYAYNGNEEVEGLDTFFGINRSL